MFQQSKSYDLWLFFLVIHAASYVISLFETAIRSQPHLRLETDRPDLENNRTLHLSPKRKRTSTVDNFAVHML